MMHVYPVYTRHIRLPGASVHSYMPPPPPIPGPVFPAPDPACVNVESGHFLRWARPGNFTTNVAFDGFEVALDGHDTGAMIIHVAIPPNTGMAFATLGSKYKLSFNASTVHANGSALATYYPHLAPPQFCCVPCTLPAMAYPASNIVPFPNTVQVGMRLQDFLWGWAGVIADAVIDLFFTFLFASKDPFEKQLQEMMDKTILQLLIELAVNAEKTTLEDLAKDLSVGALGWLLRTLRERRRTNLSVSGWHLELDAATHTLRAGPPGEPPSFEMAVPPTSAAPPQPFAPGMAPPPGTPAAR